MKYEHYDVSFKLAAVEEYYDQKAKSGISIRAYAKSKGISHATFFQWLKAYEKERDSTDDDTSEKICLSCKDDQLHPLFIKISADKQTESLPLIPDKTQTYEPEERMKLICRDISIEFDRKDLPYVLRSIRQ